MYFFVYLRRISALVLAVLSNPAAVTDPPNDETRELEEVQFEVEVEVLLAKFNVKSVDELNVNHSRQFLNELMGLESLTEVEDKIVNKFAELEVIGLKNHELERSLLPEFLKDSDYVKSLGNVDLSHLKALLEKFEKNGIPKEINEKIRSSIGSVLAKKPRKCTKGLKQYLKRFNMTCEERKN